MKRKLRWLLILIILAAFVVWLEPTRVVWGWLRGEPFFDGRPTSWWERELDRWEIYRVRNWAMWGDKPAPGFEVFERSRNNPWTWMLFQLGNEQKVNIQGSIDGRGPTLLHGDPAAEPVLRELAGHPYDRIRRMVARGLEQIEASRKQNAVD